MATLGGLTACGSAAPAAETGQPAPVRSGTDGKSRVLLAYFSRAGENYYYGGRTTLEVGNTQALAEMISGRIACDVYRIEAREPYSADYDETVARNVVEQQADARPAIADPLPAVEDYDVIMLGSGLWNVRPPMIMRTFAEGVNLRGKTILPVVTFAVSGMGLAPDTYREACPGATIGEGIAVRGEEVAQADTQVTSWLERVGLRRAA